MEQQQVGRALEAVDNDGRRGRMVPEGCCKEAKLLAWELSYAFAEEHDLEFHLQRDFQCVPDSFLYSRLDALSRQIGA